MKPQLNKIRAEAAFDEHWSLGYAKDVCKDPKFETERVGLKLIAHIERLTPIIEKLLKVIECQDAAAEEAIARLGDFGDLYSSRPLRSAQAEVLRILEGTV